MAEVYPGAEAALSHSRPPRAFEDLFEALPVDLCIGEVTGVFRVVYANQAAVRDQIAPAIARAGLTGERAHLAVYAIGDRRWDLDVYPLGQPGDTPRFAVVRAVPSIRKDTPVIDRSEAQVIPIFGNEHRRRRDRLDVSQREREVAELVAKGMTNAEIANRLFLSRATVATHIAGILTKLRFRSRAQVAVWVVEQRLGAATG